MVMGDANQVIQITLILKQNGIVAMQGLFKDKVTFYQVVQNEQLARNHIAKYYSHLIPIVKYD